MVDLSIHGALWGSNDSNCAIFCFRTFTCSMENGYWENWYSKIYSRWHFYLVYRKRQSLVSVINVEAYTQNKNRKVENFCSQFFFQWPLHVPNSKTWTKQHVSSCYSRNPEHACAVNSIWNTEVVHPLLRFSDGILTIIFWHCCRMQFVPFVPRECHYEWAELCCIDSPINHSANSRQILRNKQGPSPATLSTQRRFIDHPQQYIEIGLHWICT